MFLIPLVACMVGLAAILLLVLCITTRRYRSKDSTSAEQHHLAGYLTKTRSSWHRKRRDKNCKHSTPTELTDLEPGPSASFSAPSSSSPDPCDGPDTDISDSRILSGVRAAWQRQHEVEESFQKTDVVNIVDQHSDSERGVRIA